jgi:hypothetical protein
MRERRQNANFSGGEFSAGEVGKFKSALTREKSSWARRWCPLVGIPLAVHVVVKSQSETYQNSFKHSDAIRRKFSA